MNESYELMRQRIAKLEKQLKDQSDFFENILTLLPGHIYWLDKNNVYLGCNNQQALDGNLKSRHEIQGKKNGDLPWAEQAEELDAANEYVLQTGNSLKKIEHLRMSDEIRTYMSDKIPLRDNDANICGILGVSVDITELESMKKALKEAKEKAETANLAKSNFLANMSHDIKTPLTGIVGLSDMLFDSVENAEHKEYARMLQLSGEQLLSLLNSVLDVVASESAQHNQAQKTTFSIQDLLHNVFELEMPALKLKALNLRLDLDENVPLLIKTDKGKLYRILLNLLSNSIKFTDQGAVSIKISTKPTTDPQTIGLQFTISDTGIGIPKTETAKIFTVFYRSGASYEGKYDGLGVGLHLVKQYVDALKGEISVESIEGQGTTFNLSLPVNIVDSERAKSEKQSNKDIHLILNDINQTDKATQLTTEKKPETLKTNTNTHTHVLLVEDNPMAIKVADMILTHAGVKTDKASSAQEALALFKQYHYDFVLTDIGLPDFSGFRLTDEMRSFEKSHYPHKRTTPIIGLTAHAKQETLLQGRHCGMLEICEKPLTMKTAQTYSEMFGKQPMSDSELEARLKPQSQSELPLLDIELGISQLGSLDDLKEMLRLMVNQSMTETVPDIDIHYHARDWQAFEKSMHKFKSSCLYCATTRLLKFVQQLETLAKTNNLSQIKPVYERFCDCAVTTKHHIANWLAAQPDLGNE